MQHPITPRPSQRDADALVSLPKYIKRMPRKRCLNRRWRIKTDYIYNSAGDRTGLVVDAHAPADESRHGETIQVALVWRGEAIRCIDWELCREFADGTVVKGWHEHLWDDEHGRDIGRKIDPPMEYRDDLEKMFIYACDRWNISIVTRRDRMLRVISDAD